MMCRSPFVRDRSGSVFLSHNPKDWLQGTPFGCGKCLACRVKKRRDWTSRLILEMLKSDAGCFITLTYDELSVPWAVSQETGELQRTLDKRDFQLFMKRFRRHLERLKGRSYPVRFFGCGEYGSLGTKRPHYHILVFGASDMDLDVLKSIEYAWTDPDTKKLIGTWTCDPMNEKTIAYVAGYVMKKLIHPRKVYKVISSPSNPNIKKRIVDRSRSNKDEHGVEVEFRLMSRMPGIGSGFIGDIVALWNSSAAFRHFLTANGDVPSTFRAFGRTLFLDRFMKTKLREALNVNYDPTTYLAEVRDMYFSWLNDSSVSHTSDFVDYLVDLDSQKFRQLEERIKRQLARRSKV